MSGIEIFGGGQLGSSIQVDNLSVLTNTVLSIASANPTSTALASGQVMIAHTTVGSVITFTWRNSAGNMYRASISGASA